MRYIPGLDKDFILLPDFVQDLAFFHQLPLLGQEQS